MDKIDALISNFETSVLDRYDQKNMDEFKKTRSALRAEFERVQQELKYMTDDKNVQHRWANQYHREMLEVKVELEKVQQELDALKERSGTCNWTYDDYDCFWQTSCEEAFVIEDGTPKDNGMKFCTYCGKQLVERINENETNPCKD